MKSRFVFILGLVISLLCSFSSYANIALSKHRIFIEANLRNDALQFRNTTGATINFSADIGLTAMTEEGTVYPVADDALSAKDMIRYSPKRGSIPPGGKQVIRFSVRKPAGLDAGEYRAALLLTSEIDGQGEAERVTVQPSLTFSIPIIVRHGRTEAQTQLENPQYTLVDGKPSIKLWQSVEGNRSVFGNFTVLDEDKNEIGVLNNAAVYRPLSGRYVSIPLSSPAKGKVRVNYQEVEKYGGSLTAQTELEIK